MAELFKMCFTLHLRKLTLRVFLNWLDAASRSKPTSSNPVPSVVHCWGFLPLQPGKHSDVGSGLSDDPQHLECVHLADPVLQVKNQKRQHTVQLWS